jgi:hypothetical protein
VAANFFSAATSIIGHITAQHLLAALAVVHYCEL